MAVRPPSLRAIAAFEAAARHESFAKAADELNLSHSAISHAIRGLEARLTSPLFERHGRAVALTAHGRTLATRLRLGLSLLAEAFDEAPATGRRGLIVGAPGVVAERILAPRISAFRLQHPDVQVELRCDVAADQVTSGEIDVEIQYGPNPATGAASNLASRLIAREAIFPVAHPDLRHNDRPTRPRDLLDWPLIHSQEQPWAFWLAQQGVAQGPIDSVLKVDRDGLAIEAARKGLGVCLARSLLVEADLLQGGLVRLLDAETHSANTYRAVWDSGSAHAGMAQGFVDWLSVELTRPPTRHDSIARSPAQYAA